MNEFFGQKKSVIMQVDKNGSRYIFPLHSFEWGTFNIPFFNDNLPVIIIDSQQCWFPGYRVAKYMGYYNLWNAINSNVFPIYKTTLRKLLNYVATGELDGSPSQGDPSNRYLYHNIDLKDLPNELFDVDNMGRIQKQDHVVITEQGLYQLVGRSSKPEAVKFARWVYENVIPYAIRHFDQFNDSMYKEVIEQNKRLLSTVEANKQYISRQQEAYEDILEERDALKAKLEQINSISGDIH